MPSRRRCRWLRPSAAHPAPGGRRAKQGVRTSDGRHVPEPQACRCPSTSGIFLPSSFRRPLNPRPPVGEITENGIAPLCQCKPDKHVECAFAAATAATRRTTVRVACPSSREIHGKVTPRARLEVLHWDARLHHYCGRRRLSPLRTRRPESATTATTSAARGAP